MIKSISNLANLSNQKNIKFKLFLGPNKSSIYPEYLPDSLILSKKRYISYFLEAFDTIEGIDVFDPTNYLSSHKIYPKFLYYRTNSHWNDMGAFLAFKGFAEKYNFHYPEVSFKKGDLHSGDIIDIAKIKNFPLHLNDNWIANDHDNDNFIKEIILDQEITAFGKPSIVFNQKPLNDKVVWVIGDSFTNSLKPFINATFKEIHYKGYWVYMLDTLLSDLDQKSKKPDIIILVIVERSF